MGKLDKINALVKSVAHKNSVPVKKNDALVGNRFYCYGCGVTYVSKSGGVKCGCGSHASRIHSESNLGKAIKNGIYTDRMLKGTPYFSMGQMRKALGTDVEENKIPLIRKYGDFAIGDRVRISKCVGEKIIGAIEKYGPQKLDEASKAEIQSLQGTVTGFNARKNEVSVTWDKGAEEVVGKYNTNGFDFFDLAGKWSDWDLDRIIQMSDVGLPGSVNREGGNVSSGAMVSPM